jgi:hypothetical protein
MCAGEAWLAPIAVRSRPCTVQRRRPRPAAQTRRPGGRGAAYRALARAPWGRPLPAAFPPAGRRATSR